MFGLAGAFLIAGLSLDGAGGESAARRPPADVFDVAVPCLKGKASGRCARALVTSLNDKPEVSMISIDFEGGTVTVFSKPEKGLTSAGLQRVIAESIGEPIALPQASRQ